MKSRERCRNCGVITTRFKVISVPQPELTLESVHARGANQLARRPVEAIVCIDVIKCRARYDREALRLKRHNEHVTYQRALKVGAR